MIQKVVEQEIMVSISVIMGVYNGEKYLEEAIQSILNQTFSDFEFIIINDGSTDGTSDILQRYEKIDSRIKVHYQENAGLAAALNQGFSLARGKYVAPMDADDICLPQRLAKVFAFMEANPEVAMCGGWHKNFGMTNHIDKYPTDNAAIRCRLIFNSSFSQPTLLMRRELFIKANLAYDIAHKYCEDYGLWTKIIKHFPVANIGEVLMLYRRHSNQATHSRSREQKAAAKPLFLAQIENFGIQPTEEELKLHEAIVFMDVPFDREFLLKADAWFIKLKTANEKTLFYDAIFLAKVLGDRWFLLCYTATNWGWWMWETFWQSPLSAAANLSWQQTLKFALKCRLAWNPYLRGGVSKQLENTRWRFFKK